jgi:glycosyltransferase involved in cell wall biosynthesis
MSKLPRKIKYGKVSLILPTYTEEDTLRRCITDFQKTMAVDEIIVINNNSKFNVKNQIKGTKAKEVIERKQGYGAAIQRGLKEAKGDTIIVCEPDGTFVADDIYKLLSYSKEFDMVIGSRTTQSLIWEGANMGIFLKWGNYAVAKLAQILFNTSSLSDVGCTFRIIKREPLKRIQRKFTRKGGDFGLEMMLLVINNGLRMIQIPVNYRERPSGESTYSGSYIKAFRLGMIMITDIIKTRLNIPL